MSQLFNQQKWTTCFLCKLNHCCVIYCHRSVQNLLPHLLHSEVLSLIHENRDKYKFLKVLNTWLADKVKGAALQVS